MIKENGTLLSTAGKRGGEYRKKPLRKRK